MSVYFVQLFSELFALSYFAAYINKYLKTLEIFIAVIIGLVFGYFAYFIFEFEKLIKPGIASANFALILSFVILLLARSFTIGKSLSEILRQKTYRCFFYKWLNLIFIAVLSGALFMRYFFKSSDYPVFEGSLLDTEGILNLSFILLALLVCFVFFLTFKFIIKHINKAVAALGACVFALMLINEASGAYLLYLIRIQVIADESGNVLSYSSKAAYYAEFYCYAFLIIGLILAMFSLKTRPEYKEQSGDFDIDYRQRVAKLRSINSVFSIHFVISVCALCVALYFYLIASKPLSIDPPKIVTPNTDKYFTFNLDEVTDGHLHRYAYISNSGKKIRWFIINRFAGKITPVAVFDSCMICGDLGYIEKDGELMCVACNVRIFIPSVGKAGGCNPIPIEHFEIDEKNKLFKIPIRDIKAGENYFSEVVELSVKDPVSGAEFLNTQASRSYLYKGINYYFANEKTYEEFKQDPEKYAPTEASAPYRLTKDS